MPKSNANANTLPADIDVTVEVISPLASILIPAPSVSAEIALVLVKNMFPVLSITLEVYKPDHTFAIITLL